MEKKVTLNKDGTPRKKRVNLKPRADKGGTHALAKEGDKRIGNNFNALRESFGKPKIYETPQKLWDLAMDYVEDCANRPIVKYDSIKSGINAGMTFPVPMPRVYSLKGFAIFLGVSARTLNNYGSAEEYKEFHEVFRRISDIFDNDKLENALVGNYDPRLAATILGIRERQELAIIPQLNFDADDKEL